MGSSLLLSLPALRAYLHPITPHAAAEQLILVVWYRLRYNLWYNHAKFALDNDSKWILSTLPA